MPYVISVAESEAERQAVFRMRYEILVEELGYGYIDADHRSRTLRDAYDSEAIVLIAKDEDRVVCSVRQNRYPCGNIPAYFRERFGLDRFSAVPCEAMAFTSKLCTLKDYRRGLATFHTLRTGYQLARTSGVFLDFVECHPSIVALYLKLGYRICNELMPDPDVGQTLPLVLFLTDIERLRLAGSPLMRIAQELAGPDPEWLPTAQEAAVSADPHPSCAKLVPRLSP